jgi:hypothetical protein
MSGKRTTPLTGSVTSRLNCCRKRTSWRRRIEEFKRKTVREGRDNGKRVSGLSNESNLAPAEVARMEAGKRVTLGDVQKMFKQKNPISTFVKKSGWFLRFDRER